MTTAAPQQQELPSVQDSPKDDQSSRAVLLPVDDTDVGRLVVACRPA